MLRIALLGAMALAFASPSIAQSSMCVDIAGPKGRIEARKGHWTVLSNEERLFLNGVFAMNPTTRAGLPYGDKVVLATIEEGGGGIVFFIDGDKACDPMPIPVQVILLLHDVASGLISHEGNKS